ncbi:Pre-mRNA-splicing factor sap61, partial [Linderina macrospora]
MDSIIEQERQAYEDVERLEQAIVDLMMQDLSKHKYKLLREHKINDLLDQIQSRSSLIQRIDADESGLRKHETDGISDNKFNEFYARLADVRDFHRRNPDTAVVPPEIEYMAYKHNPEEVEEQEMARRERVRAAMDAEGDSAPMLSEQDLEAVDQQTFVGTQDMDKLDAMFSGEERIGRYVDLNEPYELFVNLKGVTRITYLEYLDEFAKFEAIERKNKAHEDYGRYLDSLQAYFEGYVGRAMPLFDLPKVQREAQEQFEADWHDQKVNGWAT